MSLSTKALVTALDDLLSSAEIKDYCPNGLQIEGCEEVQNIVTGVTASMALIEQAIAKKADAILVHHGYFWKGEDSRLIGMKGRRVRALMEHNINLIAYHLPIDVHPELGNNAQLGNVMACQNIRPLEGVSPSGIVMQGELAQPIPAAELAKRVEGQLKRAPMLEQVNTRPVQHIAWCTGGGQGYIDQAALAGVDLFVTGEVSEQTIHSAREQDIHFMAAGHHATERYGVKSVGEYLANNFALDVEFVDIPNQA